MAVGVGKLHIIEHAVVGELVAFERGDGKLMTAVITQRQPDHRCLRVRTKYGSEYEISYEDVQWVLDNGGNWPKYIYRRLKGEIDRDGNPIAGVTAHDTEPEATR